MIPECSTELICRMGMNIFTEMPEKFIGVSLHVKSAIRSVVEECSVNAKD